MIAVRPASTFFLWLVLCWLPFVQAQTLHYLGQQVVPHAFEVEGTTVGGLSGIDYDATRDRYVVISDDRSERQAARFYTLALELAAFNPQPEPGHAGVRFLGVTTLRDTAGKPHAEGMVDPESMRHASGGNLFWTSEGNARQGIGPMIEEVGADGTGLRRFTVPGHVLPGPKQGVRHNLAFESLAIDGVAGLLYVGTENALWQDGAEADVGQGSPSRILVYDFHSGQQVAEHVYLVDPVPGAPPLPLMFRTNGLVELLAGDGMLLSLERAYTQGMGNHIRLYRLDLAGASEVSDLETLQGLPYQPVGKTLLLDLGTLGMALDNFEGMTWGPRLPNGDRTLVLVSDDNFRSAQQTRFLAFSVQIGHDNENWQARR
jgi:3-phytase/alkaline phosphatase D